ncbi:peptidoglycan editing factor PgeF [Acidobacteriota bacterium]
MKQKNKFCTVPQLEKIPYLVHGFGTRNLKERDMLEKSEHRDFILVSLKQVHSDTIHIVKDLPFERLSGDALITDRPHVFLSIRTADCLPVFIVSTNPKAVAAVHCGWRGTCNGLVQKVVETMSSTLCIPPDSLVAALGPSIEQKCYEVGDDVKKSFKNQKTASRHFEAHSKREKKHFFDLKGMNRSQLVEVGVEDKNIYSVDLCTRCEKNYFSYRRNRDEKRRLINFIGMSF